MDGGLLSESDSDALSMSDLVIRFFLVNFFEQGTLDVLAGLTQSAEFRRDDAPISNLKYLRL